MDGDRWLWYNRNEPAAVGLAAPVARMLESVGDERMTRMVNAYCWAKRRRASITRRTRANSVSAYFDQVSKQAWQQWIAHQTMLINENRLTPIEPRRASSSRRRWRSSSSARARPNRISSIPE